MGFVQRKTGPNGSGATSPLSDLGVQMQGRAPQVSVIIPAYQCAQYIAQAIQSVLDQSYQNYEIIVVNDGSPDTALLEEAILPFRDRIRYVKQSTLGPSGARNRGIREAGGEYVAFLDSDDYWRPDHLAKHMAMLQGDVVVNLVYCDCILVNGDKPITRAFTLQPQSHNVTFESLLTESSAISTSTVVVSRDAIQAVGLFDENFLRCEDFDLWLRMSFAGVRIAYHPDAEVFHRVNEAGLSANREAMMAAIIRVYEKTASTLAITGEQRQIIRQMVAFAEAECAIEQLKGALEKGDYAEARAAADRASVAKDSWKLKMCVFCLRSFPRVFRSLDMARAFLLQQKRYSRRPVSANGNSSGARIEEHESPLVR